MASGTIVSRILGFARAVLLAAAIGVTTDAADAFGVANQLPNSVYAIIVGGVLNAVMVPQLVKARSNSDGGKGYVDRFVTLAITVFFSVTVFFTIAAPLLVRIYTSGWSEQQLALATAFAIGVCRSCSSMVFTRFWVRCSIPERPLGPLCGRRY